MRGRKVGIKSFVLRQLFSFFVGCMTPLISSRLPRKRKTNKKEIQLVTEKATKKLEKNVIELLLLFFFTKVALVVYTDLRGRN